MRHKNVWRKLNRDRKHRKALFRNLATQLIEHERITTTLPKAKEMRSFVEKLVHKAKRGTNADVNYIESKIYTKSAIQKLQNEIAPRFKELPGGFTRVTSLGKRRNDKADVGLIEFIGNPIEEYEKAEEENEINQYGLEPYWKWEKKLLNQEADYYEDLLRKLKMQIDKEISDTLISEQAQASSEVGKALSESMSRADEVTKQVEQKYENQKSLLLAGYDRARKEMQTHNKQKDFSRYKKLFQRYAYPIHAYKHTDEDLETQRFVMDHHKAQL